MKAQELSRKYAMAIFSLALDPWLSVLAHVQEEMTADSELMVHLGNAEIPFNDRRKKLDKLLPGETKQPIRNFLYTLLENEDIGLLDEILAALEQISRGGPQVQVARITTALDLSDSDKEQFRQKLRSQYGDHLEFVFNIDPDIIGGAIVQVGDRIIDGSISARLEAMSQALGIKR